jgi:hypothetical protein
MKKVVFVTLIAVAISILSPMSIDFSPAAKGTFLLTLDVCNAGHHLSINSESPCICEYPSSLHVLEMISSVDGFKASFLPFVTVLRKDRPPKV